MLASRFIMRNCGLQAGLENWALADFEMREIQEAIEDINSIAQTGPKWHLFK